MCIRCLSALSKFQAIVKAETERRAQREHGERIAARAAENRPWLPSEMDAQQHARFTERRYHTL